MNSANALANDKPTGPYASEMTGPGAWPETNESVFTDRAWQHGEKLVGVGQSVESWGSYQASIFNGVHVWCGAGANAAGTKVSFHKAALEGHQQQCRDAGSWCNAAAGHIGSVKETIKKNVVDGQKEISTTEHNALLPAAPTDVNPPADEMFTKWFAVMKPMMSTASDWRVPVGAPDVKVCR